VVPNGKMSSTCPAATCGTRPRRPRGAEVGERLPHPRLGQATGATCAVGHRNGHPRNGSAKRGCPVAGFDKGKLPRLWRRVEPQAFATLKGTGWQPHLPDTIFGPGARAGQPRRRPVQLGAALGGVPRAFASRGHFMHARVLVVARADVCSAGPSSRRSQCCNRSPRRFSFPLGACRSRSAPHPYTLPLCLGVLVVYCASCSLARAPAVTIVASVVTKVLSPSALLQPSACLLRLSCRLVALYPEAFRAYFSSWS